jgi:hypothetical protein
LLLGGGAALHEAQDVAFGDDAERPSVIIDDDDRRDACRQHVRGDFPKPGGGCHAVAAAGDQLDYFGHSLLLLLILR